MSSGRTSTLDFKLALLVGLTAFIALNSNTELRADKPTIPYKALSGEQIRNDSIARQIWVDIEIWESDGPLRDAENNVVPFKTNNIDAWTERLNWWHQFQEATNNQPLKHRRVGFTRIVTTDGVAGSQVLAKGPDGQLTKLSEPNPHKQFAMAVTPTIVTDTEIRLAYVFEDGDDGLITRRVCATPQFPLGRMNMFQYVQKPGNGKEKFWSLVAYPRLVTDSRTVSVVQTLDPYSFYDDLNEAFIPRPGQFEMRVHEGWTGQIRVGTNVNDPWKIAGIKNIGIANELKSVGDLAPTLFSTSGGVLEVFDSKSGIVGVRTFQTGTASLRWKVKGLMGVDEVCELTIHVAADTSRIDTVIKQLLPDASIKVTKIANDSMILSGSVSSSEDVQLLMEVARAFSPFVINHLVIKPKTTDVSSRIQEMAERQENLVPIETPDPQPSNSPQESRRTIHVAETVGSESELEVLIGCSRNCKSTSDLVRLAISNPAAIEVVQYSSKEFSIVGLASGRSTLSLWFNGEEQPEIYTIRVNQDTTSKESPSRKLQISEATPVEKRPKLSDEFNARAMSGQPEPNRPAKESKRHRAQLTTDDAERLLDEVRGLRRDVRRLTEAVEQNQKTNRQSNFDRNSEEASDRIKQLLSKAVSVDAEGDDGRGIPLRQTIKQIRDQSSVNLIIDDGGLTEQGVSAADHVNVALKNVTARSALDLILEPLGLDYMIRDEVVIVTSKVRTLGELSVQTYAVADILELFVPLSEPGAARNAMQKLVDVVTTSVAPDRWEKSGGEGNAQYFDSTRSLVIRQTQGVHEEVAELLSQIRKTGRMPRKPLQAKRGVPKPQSKIEQTKFDSPQESSPLRIMCFAIADLVATSADSSPQSKAAEVWELLKLVDEIKDSVGTECWEESGGLCAIDFADSNQTLLVRGSQSTHEAVARALSKKRRAKDSKIVFETRFLQSPDSDFFESIGVHLEMDERTRCVKLTKSDAESIEAFLVKRDGTSYLVPKVTCPNGVIACVHNEFQGSDGRIAGMKLNIRGILTSKYDAVKMSVAVNPQNLVNELTGRVQRVEFGQCVLLDLTDEFRRNSAWTSKDGRCLVLIRPTLAEEEFEAIAKPGVVPTEANPKR